MVDESALCASSLGRFRGGKPSITEVGFRQKKGAGGLPIGTLAYQGWRPGPWWNGTSFRSSSLILGHSRLLRVRGERTGNHSAGKTCNEVAAPHSITSSARG